MSELPKGFTCADCGHFERFVGWVYAHWDDELIFNCKCGARYEIHQGNATKVASDGKTRKKS